MKRRDETGHPYHSSGSHQGIKPDSWHGSASTTNSSRSQDGFRPRHQKETYSGQGTHHFHHGRPNKANKPHYHSSPAQGINTHNAFHQNKHHAQNHQNSDAFNSHNKTGGWIEDDNFENPQKPIHSSGFSSHSKSGFSRQKPIHGSGFSPHNKPHCHSSPAQGINTHNAFHHNKHHAQNHQNSDAFNPQNKIGGWLEDNNFENPHKPIHSSGFIPHSKAGFSPQEPIHSSGCSPHNKPHCRSSPAKGINTHNAFHHSKHHAQNQQNSDAFKPQNKTGGWLEDDNFENPQKPMHSSGFASNCRPRSMESKNHLMHIHGEKPEKDSRRSFQGNHGSGFQPQEKRLEKNAAAQYDNSCHNTEQEGSYKNHSYSSSCADDRNNGCPDYLHHSKTDRYNEFSNAPGFSDSGIRPLKNLQEPFHLGTSCMEEDEGDDDDEDEFSSDSEEDRAIDKAYRKLLSKVQEVVDRICGTTKPSLIGNVELSCLVCSPLQHFKGWTALLAHAQNFRKKKVIQHRGFHRALESVLKVKEAQGQGQEQETAADVCVSLIDSSLSESHTIVWPPVVVIEIIDLKSHLNQSKVNSNEPLIAQGKGTAEDTTIQTLLSQELQSLHPKGIISCGKSKSVILFEASSLGYMEAKAMNDRLRERKRGRQNLSDFKEHKHSSFLREYHGTTMLLSGYLAEPADLKIIDPNKTIVKDWSEESYREKVQGANKRMKQDHEYKQAKLKAMELEVVTLSEEKEKNKIHKQLISCQIKKSDEEIEKQQNIICQMRESFTKEDRELFKTFEEKMHEIDKDGSTKVNKLKTDLERGEKLYEEERISRMKQIQSRHLALQELKQGYEKLAEEKALDREAEIIIKQKNFMEEVWKAEVKINSKIQLLESSLQSDQQDEMKKLAEESEREREAFYREWMKENETMKKEVEELRKNKEQVQESDKVKDSEQVQPPECAVCWDHLTPENRALLVPCGHTQVCVECAQAVFQTKKGCPICRQGIAKKPIKCPKSLLGS